LAKKLPFPIEGFAKALIGLANGIATGLETTGLETIGLE
jgi:hypothetical protein